MFEDCPPGAVDYWGVAAGTFDDDDRDDLVFLRDSTLEPTRRGIEIRLSSDDTPRCALMPTLRPRAVLAGDFGLGVGGDEILVLSFDASNQRHAILIEGGLEAPTFTQQVTEGVESGYTEYDPYDIRFLAGAGGGQVLYGGPSAALSDTSSNLNAGLHALRTASGAGVGEVLDVALVPVGEEVRTLVVTAGELHWYEASAVLADGPVDAVASIDHGVDGVRAAGFGDFEPNSSGSDGCPDLLFMTSSSPPATFGMDVQCDQDEVDLGPLVTYQTVGFGVGEEGLDVSSGVMDDQDGDEVLLFGLTAADQLEVDARYNVRFDQDPDAPSWECGASGTRELCGEGGSLIPSNAEVAWARSVRANVDDDTDSELVFVGPENLVGCVDRTASFGPCSL